MKMQLSFFYAPRPKLSLCEIETILKQRLTFGYKGKSRDWLARKCEEGAFDLLPERGAHQDDADRWWVDAECFLMWLARQEGHPVTGINVNKILGIQVMAA